MKLGGWAFFFSSIVTESARRHNHRDSPWAGSLQNHGLEEKAVLFCKQEQPRPRGQSRSWKQGKGYLRAMRRDMQNQVLAPAQSEQVQGMCKLKEMISRAENLGLQVMSTSGLAMTQTGT